MQSIHQQDSGTKSLEHRDMPADDTKPVRKRLASEQKGYATDAISVAIARDVLRRVREGSLPNADEEKEPWAT